MISWREAVTRGARSGSIASLLSAVTLAACGRIENHSAAGPLHGPSQWVWGRGAAYRRRPAWRYTAIGYAIHHVASIGWATVHEKHVVRLTHADSPAARLLAASATAAIACAVDYKIAQGRAQPGFDKQLSRTSLFFVYAAFAVGLALGGSPSGRRRRGDER
jgi:hypothetical protein